MAQLTCKHEQHQTYLLPRGFRFLKLFIVIQIGHSRGKGEIGVSEWESLEPGIECGRKKAVKTTSLLCFGEGTTPSLKPTELSIVRPCTSHNKMPK
jgi:hypothetical protein